MIDAATIRKRLAACKRDGMSFDAAWKSAVGATPSRLNCGEETEAHFAYRQLRDAYLGVNAPKVGLSRDLSDEDYSVTSRGRNRTGRGDAR